MTYLFRSSVTDPFARGREFGERHARQIGAAVEAYKGLWDRAATRAYDLTAMGGEALVQVAAFAPSLHAEMLGLAEGSGVAPELIGALNARTEILAALGSKLQGECSAVVRVDPFGAAPVAVQTWDWYTDFAENWLVWEIPHADGSVTTTVTEYGIVGKAGVNSRGLGLLFTILHHVDDGERIGVPVHVASRWMLDSQSDINQAVQLLVSADVSASSSLTVVAAIHGESAVVSVELFPGGPGLVMPNPDGLLVHTNHFLSPKAAPGDTEPMRFPDTLVRRDLLTRRLSNRSGLTSSDLLAAMDSHLGTIGAVCCHPDERLPLTGQYATLTTVIFDVANGTLRALPGGPCRHTKQPELAVANSRSH